MAVLAMPFSTVKHLAADGRLVKRYVGTYPFYYEDVNRFIMDLNAGKIHVGRIGKKAKAKQG